MSILARKKMIIETMMKNQKALVTRVMVFREEAVLVLVLWEDY